MSIDKSLRAATESQSELDTFVAKVVRATIETMDHRLGQSPFIRSKECAHLLEVTPEHLCAMRARGEGPTWSGEGKWVRYERSVVLDWLRTLPRQSSSTSPKPAPVAIARSRRRDSG